VSTQVAHAPYVGRAGELRLAEAGRKAVAAGSGVLLLVSGDAGIGKTRFCEEVATRARTAGMPVAWGRCWAGGGAPPLWPWHGVLEELCGQHAAAVLAGDQGIDDVDPERFARFAAVVEALRDTCLDRPAMVVIDDAHDADAGAVLLARFVARALSSLPLLLVVTRREHEPPPGSTVALLLSELAREGRGIPLGGLDASESGALLSSLGVTPTVDDPAARATSAPGDDPVTSLHRLTGGNPLFLHELAAAGPIDQLSSVMPDGVRHAIDERLRGLDASTCRILGHAALLGMEASVVEAAQLAGVDVGHVVACAVPGAAAGVVAYDGRDRLTFQHELLREGLAATLAPAERLDAHARAVVVLRDVDGLDAVSRRARHARAAAIRSTDDARVAVEASTIAARAMVHGFSFEQGARLFGDAIDISERAGLAEPRAELWVEHAETVLQCGRLARARELFDRAATQALQEDDAECLARAAIGLGGVWVNEHRSPDQQARVQALQERARRGLPPGEEALVARLTVRLAAEERYRLGPLDAVRGAVDAARATGDEQALAEALSLWNHSLLAPEHAPLRLPVADELIAVASSAGSGLLVQVGLCWRAVDLYLAGDRRAARALEDFRLRVDALQNQSLLYIVGVLDVMGLLRDGRFAEAEDAAAACFDDGTEVGDADALAYYSAHLGAIRWAQGRAGEILPLVADVAVSPTLPVGDEVFPAAVAGLAAAAGDLAWARTALDRLLAGGLRAIPRSSTWLVTMLSVVEAAQALDDTAVAAEAYELLQPFGHLPVMPSLAVACFGSVERLLGLAAGTCGRTDDAVRHLERAMDENARLRNRPLVAISGADLAVALVARGASGDVAAALDRLDGAIAAGTAMGLDARVDGWERLRKEISATWQPAVPTGERVGSFRHVGPHWVVACDGRELIVAHSVGMTYLRRLLAQPGVPFAAAELAGGGDEVIDVSDQAILDDRARASYRNRIVDLEADLAEAEAFADVEREAQLRHELDLLLDELGRATGLGGRDRTFASSSERARTAVRKAIKRSIDRIAEQDAGIGALLHASVTTGSSCRYAPTDACPARWLTA